MAKQAHQQAEAHKFSCVPTEHLKRRDLREHSDFDITL
jgi:hypothetical protein